MDARIIRSNETYKLVNLVTGAIEEGGLGRVAAFNTQNRLWALGVKTSAVVD